MTIDIIGNGPSNLAYQPNNHYVIGCNVPQHGFRCDALSIIDNQPIVWMRNNSWAPRVPVFCTDTARDYARTKDISGDWMSVYQKRERYNAGLHAARYSATLSKNIHLWGFDSLFSDLLDSQMDKLVPRYRRPPLNKHWRPHWNELFDEFTDVNFFIHLPAGLEIGFQKTNVFASYFAN